MNSITPNMVAVKPIPSIVAEAAPPEIKDKNDDLLAAIDVLGSRRQELNRAEAAVAAAESHDVLAAHKAAEVGDVPPPLTRPLKEEDLSEATRAFQAAESVVVERQRSLVTTVIEHRSHWLEVAGSELQVVQERCENALAQFRKELLHLVAAKSVFRDIGEANYSGKGWPRGALLDFRVPKLAGATDRSLVSLLAEARGIDPRQVVHERRSGWDEAFTAGIRTRSGDLALPVPRDFEGGGA